MTLYLDSSALIKRYLVEARSGEVERQIAAAARLGTSIISRAEVSAGLARASRLNWLTQEGAADALRAFQRHWFSLFRVHIRESTVETAEALAWEHGLRGYDAVHLACALSWRDSISSPITMATFDRQLWEAAIEAGMDVWPETLGSASGG